MQSSYSRCHFAEVMFDVIRVKTLGAVPEEVQRCSFCGASCELVEPPRKFGANLEIVLRRWKDGEELTDNVKAAINKELEQSWGNAFSTAADALQAEGKPKYKYTVQYKKWVEAE